MAAQFDDDEPGRCWGCDYLLRGVESGRCPECGRGFERGVAGSLNYGRAIGRLGRWMVGRIGWRLNLIAGAGAMLILWTTRWPVKGWRFSLLDLRFYGPIWEWRERAPGMSGVDAAYSVGLLLAAGTLLWWLIRATLRMIGVVYYRPPREFRGRFWGRSVLLLATAAATIAAVGVGWPYRLGQRWAREWEAVPQPSIFVRFDPPLLDLAGAEAPFRAVMLRGRTARERRSGMKMLAEAFIGINIDHDALLHEILDSETNLDNKILALHLSGEFASVELESALAPRLNDPSPAIRIAAADGLGILWNGAMDGGRKIPGDFNIGDPPIDWMGRWEHQTAKRPANARKRLESMMLTAATLEERESAAKALVYAPAPGFQLRYAEWGVLIGEGPGKMRFTNALRDDVPPFVHRIGNPIAEFENRITLMKPHGMGKPVIHLTVDRPMAIELEILMNDGRPWMAYPLCDDLVLLNGTFGESRDFKSGDDERLGPRRTIRMLDPKGVAPLAGLREGYSWLSAQHREYAWFDPTGQWNMVNSRDLEKLSTVGGMGLFWQSLIVTPKPLADAHLAVVPPEAKFDWWKRLRQTPCSWVSSRGESERFLYYDGPTIMPSPIIMKLEAGVLSWTENDFARPQTPLRPDNIRDSQVRSAVFIEVHGKDVRGFWIDSDALTAENSETIAEKTLSSIDLSDFTARLMKHGLKEAEARAMVDCWKKSFFETDGRRTLVIMSQADYGRFVQ